MSVANIRASRRKLKLRQKLGHAPRKAGKSSAEQFRLKRKDGKK